MAWQRDQCDQMRWLVYGIVLGAICGPARKLRLSVCRLDVLTRTNFIRKVQFVDCTPHKPGLQTGTQFANCVNPVCKLL